MDKIDILKAHGSQNDLFIVEGAPGELVTAAELPVLVRRLCDRSGHLGGDGIYFLDARPTPAVATFFNPDGSAATFCGNGMRCVGRLLLDRYGTASVTVRSGGHEFVVRRTDPTPEGVPQTIVELPAVDFGEVDAPVPVLHPTRRFTALAVPNSHLVSIVDAYDEAELVEVGQRLAASRREFPDGANLSYVLPLGGDLGGDEVFVRTYERGAGLTLSCGSGVAASRAVCSRLGRFAPDQPVVVRNSGGVTRAWLSERDGRWFPRIEGNASFVYRATVDASLLTTDHPIALDRAPFADETAAFGALDGANRRALHADKYAIFVK